MKSCQLSTEYVDNIPKCTEQRQTFRPRKSDIDFTDLDENHPLYTHIVVKRRVKETLDSFTLRKWLNSNYKLALERYEQHKPMREDIGRLRKALCEEWGLKDVRFECGWNETHFRGCLLSFKGLTDQHPNIMHRLRGFIFSLK